MASARRRPLTRDEELRIIRDAMGNALEEIDITLFSPGLRPAEERVDHTALRASMPVLNPPLSQTIIEDREDRL